MKRRFAGVTDPGQVRTVNQDDYYIDTQEGRFFIVADGMGGHAGGQEASQIAAKEIQAYLYEHWDSDESSDVLLKKAILRANEAILADQANNPQRRDMGTTVVILIFRNDESWRAHIGDSRLYRFRDSHLEQITTDHTWVALALKSGDLTDEQAKYHPWRHVLSQCLGRKEINHLDIEPLEVLSGDRFLLCSDGLTEEVPDLSISTIFSNNHDCHKAAQMLVEEANNSGGSDNITAIIVAQD